MQGEVRKATQEHVEPQAPDPLAGLFEGDVLAEADEKRLELDPKAHFGAGVGGIGQRASREADQAWRLAGVAPSNAGAWLRFGSARSALVGRRTRVVSALSMRCMRSWRPFCSGSAGPDDHGGCRAWSTRGSARGRDRLRGEPLSVLLPRSQKRAEKTPAAPRSRAGPRTPSARDREAEQEALEARILQDSRRRAPRASGGRRPCWGRGPMTGPGKLARPPSRMCPARCDEELAHRLGRAVWATLRGARALAERVEDRLGSLLYGDVRLVVGQDELVSFGTEAWLVSVERGKPNCSAGGAPDR